MLAKLGLFGHIDRFSCDVPASNILSICCASEDGYPLDRSWKRSSGRPKTTWLDHISYDTGTSLTDTFFLAQDRLQWRAVATAAKATRT